MAAEKAAAIEAAEEATHKEVAEHRAARATAKKKTQKAQKGGKTKEKNPQKDKKCTKSAKKGKSNGSNSVKASGVTKGGRKETTRLKASYPDPLRCAVGIGGDVWCGERDGTIAVRSGTTAEALFNPKPDFVSEGSKPT